MTWRSVFPSKPRQWVLSLALVVALFPLVGWIGGGYWLFDLFNHFQYQYLAYFSVSLLLLLAMRACRGAAIVAVLLLLPLVRIAPSYFVPAEGVTSHKSVRVASFNVLVSNDRYEDTLRWVRESQPDCVYFSETSEKWAKELEALSSDYPYSIENNNGFAFYSKFPFRRYRIVYCSQYRFPLLIAHLEMPQGEVMFCGIHPLPPVTPRWARALRETMEVLAQEVKSEQGSVIVAGDFNLTRWSENATMLERARLLDASRGQSPEATWMRGNPLLTIPIDRILYRGTDMSCQTFHIGPDLGSDHRPVIAEIFW